MNQEIQNSQNITENSIAIHYDMERSYTAYSGSVIIGRALPDLRDGLKPVHRRILYAMYEDGMEFNKPYVKSASVVGDVMKKYHPHGDSSIYDAMVRLAQEFVMCAPLIDGQGNFGSIDGDSAAAMRYTEARMAKISQYLMHDIEKNTVDFRDNYNAAYREPVVLPAAFPNLLVNGSSGIAVGMATNIPPFNLTEIMEACIFCLQNKNATNHDLLKIITGPDFPTGGTIIGVNNIRNAMINGKGSIMMRGIANIETSGNRQVIIITEIPYQVNKARLIEKIVELIKDKRIDGIHDIRDESALDGIRVVIELKRDAIGEVVLNRLYKYTPLQETFGVNMMMIHNMRPVLMPVFEVIKAFLEFRIVVVTKRIAFELQKLRNKVHIFIGLAVAISEIDTTIDIVRAADDVSHARTKLLEKTWKASFLNDVSEVIERDLNVIDEDNNCKLTEEQVKSILELRLNRLTKLEKNKLVEEINQLAAEIQKCLTLLNNPDKLEELIIAEFTAIKDNFPMKRRTQIIDGDIDEDIENLMEKEDMVVTVTKAGYVKRVALDAYRTQARGGKGKSGQMVSEEDCVEQLFITNTHVYVLFFFDSGIVYRTKVHQLPEGEAAARGRAINNIFPVSLESKIKKVMALPEDETTWGDYEIVFVTAKGNIRRNSLEDFRNINAGGKIAIRFDESPEDDGDYLIDVNLCKADDHIMISSHLGKSIRFPVNALRVFKSRTSDGVRAIKLAMSDYVIAASILKNVQFQDIIIRDQYLSIDYSERSHFNEENIVPENCDLLTKEEIIDYSKNEELILSITENGFGKMTSSYEYRVTNRGGTGITNILTSKRNGGVIGSFPVVLTDTIMLITNKGKVIRIPVNNIRISSRNTQGVTLFKLGQGEKVKYSAKVVEQESQEIAE